jgi:hypothetical protein
MAFANDNTPRILFLDIETKLIEAYTFGIRDQHLTYKQIKDAKDARSIHCVGLKWHGERKTTVLSEWEHGYRGMLEGVHKALCEADAVATYNGARFDLPKLQGQFLIEGMTPPPPPTQIDIFKSVRRMGFICNKLDYIAPILGLGSKVKHDGLEMWIAVRNECPKAQAKMARYCAGDVRLTEEVYDRVLPYIVNHPRLHETPPKDCASCGSDNVQRRGYNRSKAFKTERLQCMDCGGWHTGRRTAA